MNDLSVRFYWDIGSTNTYFAFHLLRPIAHRYGARIEYVPLNLGYVFRKHNYALTDEPAAKMRNRLVDLMRWAKKYNLPFRMPDEFPIKTSRVLRGSLVMREYGFEDSYMEDVFSRYWEKNDASIATYEGLASTVAELGVDPKIFEEKAESEEVCQQIIDLTDQALADGVFGAPVTAVEGELYWGKDRLEFVEDHLQELTRRSTV